MRFIKQRLHTVVTVHGWGRVSEKMPVAFYCLDRFSFGLIYAAYHCSYYFYIHFSKKFKYPGAYSNSAHNNTGPYKQAGYYMPKAWSFSHLPHFIIVTISRPSTYRVVVP
jgi:hypothetical protein